MANTKEAFDYIRNLSSGERDHLSSLWSDPKINPDRDISYIQWVAKNVVGGAVNPATTKSTSPQVNSGAKLAEDFLPPPSQQPIQDQDNDPTSTHVKIDSDPTDKPIRVSIVDPNSPGSTLIDALKGKQKETGFTAPKFADRNYLNSYLAPWQQMGIKLRESIATPPATTAGKTAPGTTGTTVATTTPGEGKEQRIKEGWGGLIYEMRNLAETGRKILGEMEKGNKAGPFPRNYNPYENNNPQTRPVPGLGLALDLATGQKMTPPVGRGETVENKETGGSTFLNFLNGLMNPHGGGKGSIDEGRQRGGKLGALQQAGGHISSMMQSGEGVGGVGDLMQGIGSLASMIPGIGGVVGGVLKFGGALIKSIGSLEQWSRNLHNANMQFAEFSGSMAMVGAKQEIFEMDMNRRKGDARSASAERLAWSQRISSEASFGRENMIANVKNDLMAGLNLAVSMIQNPTKTMEEMKKILEEIEKQGKEEEGLGIINEANQASEEYWKNHQRPNRFQG